jgi:hypothetical protein
MRLDPLDALPFPADVNAPAPLAPLVRQALVAMLDALEGRPSLPAGVALFVDNGFGYRPVDQVRAPGWCADLRAALWRGDILAVRELLQGPGRYGFAPYANPQVTTAIARGFDALLAVFEANARALAPTAIPLELHAALTRGLASDSPVPAVTLPAPPEPCRMNTDRSPQLPRGTPIVLPPTAPAPLRALTLWQPWAYAITRLGKRIENRSRPPGPSLVGTTVAIHAAAKHDVAAERDAIAWIHRTFSAECYVPAEPPRGAIVALARVVGSVTASDDPWFVGPVGWQLADVIALPTPVSCRGMQGVWPVPADVAARVRELAAGVAVACSCCPRAEQYNGYGSDGPRIFTCPKGCSCHE